MPAISINEAKLLAGELQKTFPKSTGQAPKRGHWLNHIARANGYRDWNAMEAIAPSYAPDMEYGTYGDAFYGLAWVEMPGHESVLYMLTTPDWKVAHPSTGWPGRLADKVREHVRHDFREMVFDYRYAPSEGSEAIECGPAVVTSSDSSVRILLWWFKDRYTVGMNLTTAFIPMNKLQFDYPAYGYEPRVDQFLNTLTGLERRRRTCLYRTALPNAPGGLFLPVLVTEEESTGIAAAGWQPSDHVTVDKQVYETNVAWSLSRQDVSVISHRYCSKHPQPEEEEEEFDFYGMSED